MPEKKLVPLGKFAQQSFRFAFRFLGALLIEGRNMAAVEQIEWRHERL